MKELNLIVGDIDEKSSSILQSPSVLKIILGDYSVRELMKIYPSKTFIRIFLDLVIGPMRPILNGLSKNISYINVGIADLLKISCDWCSLCNGVIETARQNLIENPELWKHLNESDFIIIDKYLNFILDERKIEVTQTQIDHFSDLNFGTNTTIQSLFSMCYLKFELIELRWCPFKRSGEFYYRNKDRRFINPTKENIRLIGAVLMKEESITCNNCPSIVNENANVFIEEQSSHLDHLFDDLIKYIESGKSLENKDKIDPNDNLILQMVTKY